MSWRQAGEVGSSHAIALMATLVRRLPRRVTRWLVPPIALYYLLAAPRARRSSRDYLRRVLPAPPRWRDLYRHVATFALCTLDRPYLLMNRFDEFAFETVDYPIADDLRRAGIGAFLIGAHLGSFEALHAVARKYVDPRVFMLMFEDNAQKIGAVLHALNPGIAGQVIALGRPGSMLRVRDVLDEGAFVGLLADRQLDGPRAGARADDVIALPFLGSTALFPLGPFRMAAMLRAPALLIVGLFVGGNRYRLVFESIHDFRGTSPSDAAIEQAARTYVARLEHHCREHPFNWFNFYPFWDGRGGSVRATPAAAGDLPDARTFR